MNSDQSKKIMTVELDTSDANKQFGIHFLHRLLYGELTVLINGDDVNFDNYSIDKRHDEAIVHVWVLILILLLSKSLEPPLQFQNFKLL